MKFPLYSLLSVTPPLIIAAGIVVGIGLLGFGGAPLVAWTASIAAALYLIGAPAWLWLAYVPLALLLHVRPLRRQLSRGVMQLMNALGSLPVISQTEKEAIDAGTVWVEGELFSGSPDWHRILDQGDSELSAAEQAFLDGPVDQVCAITDSWEVQKRRDLPPDTWEFLKRERFFGMIIPEKYGGLGFTPSANSAVVAKLASVDTALAVTVMVPNSLGPAELLLHYGTEAQKNRWLPGLARGEDIPAFALTEPGAGSDAGAISSHGVVFRGEDGQLHVRLQWQKRYITLAAISTVLGLAFKLRDPENLLGRGADLGITCGLVPTDTPGVVLGRRHDPLGVPFYNAPTEGHDVVLPLEELIIGGVAGAGQGWRMLMESLAAGRGISLPAMSTGGIQKVARVAGAHALVRRQFGLSIGKFEGIEEPLARIGGWAYILEAARRFTNGGLDAGAKPAVVTAMAKYHFTELQRKAINDGMDILGGNGISLGPRNLLASNYIGTPIAITVEGANIMTRTLMIFGQGAIRSHPYVLEEIRALQSNDVKAFDEAFWGHLGHIVRNSFRALGLSLTRGRLAASPVTGPTARYFQKLTWASASFALWADIAMAALGGNLKRKEKLTGRFADIFSWLYLGSAVLKRLEAEGRRTEDLPFIHWSMRYALSRIQEAFEGLLENFEMPLLGRLITRPVVVWSRLNSFGSEPSDALGAEVARALQVPGEQRERLTGAIYRPTDREAALGRLEHAFGLAYQAEAIFRIMKLAVRADTLPKLPLLELTELAVERGVITEQQADVLRQAEEARADSLQVDSFTLEEYLQSAAFQPSSPRSAAEAGANASHSTVRTAA
jgi:acyl-CoA dehydrogenase